MAGSVGLWGLLIQAWFIDLGVVSTGYMVYRLFSRSRDEGGDA